MEQKGMTARICAFSRAYHTEHNNVCIFEDSIAKKLLLKHEYETTANHMADGIGYFNPTFQGSREEGLRWIVDNVLSQTPLARAAFAEKSLEVAVLHGAKQYMICAAGFDTFAYRQPDWAKELQIFELDYPTTSNEKQSRLEQGNVPKPQNINYIATDFSSGDWEKELLSCGVYDTEKVTFCSLLGLIYYLSKKDFEAMISKISSLIPVNSSIVFDYPNEHYFDHQKKHSELAKASNEEMLACYSYHEMEIMLEKHGLLLFEHLNADQMTKEYFTEYNKANPEHIMKAQDNVNYCLAVKKF